MPKKKKDEVPVAPLPAIDHSYVQALKIQTLVLRTLSLPGSCSADRAQELASTR